MDRYLKRLVRHAMLRKDPDFRVFLQVKMIMWIMIILRLQEVKLSASLEVKRSLGEKVTRAVEALENRTSRS